MAGPVKKQLTAGAAFYRLGCNCVFPSSFRVPSRKILDGERKIRAYENKFDICGMFARIHLRRCDGGARNADLAKSAADYQGVRQTRKSGNGARQIGKRVCESAVRCQMANLLRRAVVAFRKNEGTVSDSLRLL